MCDGTRRARGRASSPGSPAFDIDRLAAPLHVAEYAAFHRPGRRRRNWRNASRSSARQISSTGIEWNSWRGSRTGGLPPHSPRENAGLASNTHIGTGSLEQHAIAALWGSIPVHRRCSAAASNETRHKGNGTAGRAPNPQRPASLRLVLFVPAGYRSKSARSTAHELHAGRRNVESRHDLNTAAVALNGGFRRRRSKSHRGCA